VLRHAGEKSFHSLGCFLFVVPFASTWWGAVNSSTVPIVLVVEDDWLLRLLAVEVMEDAGFVALLAANADEAIAILEHRGDITLIICG
jgi:hypothetical protein